MGDPNPTALLVVDTDVLIDYLRDQAEAVAFLEGSAQPLALSVVIVAAPVRTQPWHRAGRCADRRQRGGSERHLGHPQPPPFPDAGRGAGALRQALTPRNHPAECRRRGRCSLTPAHGAASPLPLLALLANGIPSIWPRCRMWGATRISRFSPREEGRAPAGGICLGHHK